MKDRYIEKLNYINEVLDHQKIILKLMTLLELNRDKLSFDVPEWELMERGVKHDADKFNQDIANKVVSLYMADDIDEHEVYLAKSNHRINNSHHVEYHNNVDEKLSNADICEMCCDWMASAKKRYYRGTDRATNFEKTKEIALQVVDKHGFSSHKNKFIETLDLLNSLVDLGEL